MRNLKRENSRKEKSTILCTNIIHQKPLWGKNGWYDITLCWYCLIKNFIWETQRKKNSYKEKSAIWCLQQIINQRDSPLILANLKVNSYQCTQYIRNVKYGRLCEYLCEIITWLSLQMFVSPYYLWNRTILVQNITLNITCLHLYNTSCITFIDNDHWFIASTPHNFSMWYIILSSYTHLCEALYNTMSEWLMKLTIKCLFKDYHKMVFPYSYQAYFNDLEFEDLIDNHNHYIQPDHGFFQMNIPRSLVLLRYQKIFLTSIHQHLVGVALLLDSKSLQK
jgi:hypothetical protein